MEIIKIGAVWCPGCLVMKKVWNNVLSDYQLDIIELDYDMDNVEVCKYNVGKVLPVVIFLDNNGNNYYLYVDAISYYNKTENTYMINDNDIII